MDRNPACEACDRVGSILPASEILQAGLKNSLSGRREIGPGTGARQDVIAAQHHRYVVGIQHERAQRSRTTGDRALSQGDVAKLTNVHAFRRYRRSWRW